MIRRSMYASGLGMAIAMAVALPPPAMAQGTTVIGGSAGGVTINEAVLNSLGRPPNLADYYRTGLPGAVTASGAVTVPPTSTPRFSLSPPTSTPRSSLSPAALALLGGQTASGAGQLDTGQPSLGHLPSVSLRPPPVTPPATQTAGTSETASQISAAASTTVEAAAIAEIPPVSTEVVVATETTVAEDAVAEASQTAALPPASTQERFLFAAESAELPADAVGLLDAVVSRLEAAPDLRLQILAYAAGTDETTSQARRLSLSRALAVRKYLIDKGIGRTRLDVRALGNRAEDGPVDRVDLVLVAG